MFAETSWQCEETVELLNGEENLGRVNVCLLLNGLIAFGWWRRNAFGD
jgi:hypothetical protein